MAILNHRPPSTIDERTSTSIWPGAPGSNRRLTLPFTVVGPKALGLRVRPRHPGVQIAEAIGKRSVDVLIAAIVLIVLSPLLIGLALAIKLDSPGAVFYRHTRIGKNGGQFSVWKFRSMRCDISGEEIAAAMEKDAYRIHSPVCKSPNDPRITRVGRMIRRTALDEVPQMFNVLMGEMSLVGPRPLVAAEVAELPPIHYSYRNSVLPGVTGLWQVFRTTEPASSNGSTSISCMWLADRCGSTPTYWP